MRRGQSAGLGPSPTQTENTAEEGQSQSDGDAYVHDSDVLLSSRRRGNSN